MRKWLMIAIGIGVSIVFGWLTVRALDWHAVGAALRNANWAILPLAFPLLVGSIFLRAWRWRLILREHPQARWGALTLAAGIGAGANAILPGKLGEAVAAHALGRLADISRIQSLGILVITRLVDLFVLFALVLCASFVLPSPTLRSVRYFSLLAAGVCATLLLVPLLLRAGGARRLLASLRGTLQRVLGAAPLDMVEKFGRGLGTAGHWSQLAAFIVSTLLLWIVLSTSLLVALRAFGIQAAAPLAPLLMALIAVSAMLPAAPGNVGTFHYFGLLALSLVGVESGLAAACIITYHALDMVCALALGAVCGAIARTPLLLLRAAQPGVLKERTAPAAGLVAPESSPRRDPGRAAPERAQPAIATTEDL